MNTNVRAFGKRKKHVTNNKHIGLSPIPMPSARTVNTLYSRVHGVGMVFISQARAFEMFRMPEFSLDLCTSILVQEIAFRINTQWMGIEHEIGAHASAPALLMNTDDDDADDVLYTAIRVAHFMLEEYRSRDSSTHLY